MHPVWLLIPLLFTTGCLADVIAVPEAEPTLQTSPIDVSLNAASDIATENSGYLWLNLQPVDKPEPIPPTLSPWGLTHESLGSDGVSVARHYVPEPNALWLFSAGLLLLLVARLMRLYNRARKHRAREPRDTEPQ